MRHMVKLMIGLLGVTWLSAHLTVAAQTPLDVVGWGHLRGQIIVSGELPSTEEERIPSDLAICTEGKAGITDDNLLIDPAGGLADVFVMLVQDDSEAELPIHPVYRSRQDQAVTLEFSNCRLRPHAVVLLTGQELMVKNRDEVGHHCQIDGLHNHDNLLIARSSEYSLQFQQSDRTPVKVRCGIHPWIDGLILIKEHPYNVISQADGRFEIRNIPPGTWKFMFWHSKTGYLDEMRVAGFKVSPQGEITTPISAGSTVDLGEIILPGQAFKE
ncbi:MAG: hypothetical protein MK108_09595 [Mariniblastus sp.]|nr:hypothetical protein [Mariniblastus sp.]